MRKLLLIFCWRGDEERIERHLPYWHKSGCELLFVCPHDAPITTHPCLCGHRSQQYGPELLRRHMVGMAHALNMGADHIYCTEADSICLGPAPDPPEQAIGGYVFPDPANPAFRARTFVHWVWSFDRLTLARFVASAAADPDALKEQFPDRWLAWVCERHGLEVRHDKRVFSRNQLDTPELMTEARLAIIEGAWALHGIKTGQQLHDLLRP